MGNKQSVHPWMTMFYMRYNLPFILDGWHTFVTLAGCIWLGLPPRAQDSLLRPEESQHPRVQVSLGSGQPAGHADQRSCSTSVWRPSLTAAMFRYSGFNDETLDSFLRLKATCIIYALCVCVKDLHKYMPTVPGQSRIRSPCPLSCTDPMYLCVCSWFWQTNV